MRTLGFLAVVFCFLVDLGSAQTVGNRPGSTPAAKTLSDRPALVGTSPDALINRIDTQDLIKKGQKDGVIMFCCIVKDTGEAVWSIAYRGTPGSKLLEQEVLKRLKEAKFIPALRNGKPVSVYFYGTVTFAIVNAKPRLRIFCNQEAEELKKESDFICPQPYVGGDSKFDGFHYPPHSAGVPVTGTAEVAVTVDVAGNLKAIELVSEYPASILLKFGQAALNDFNGAKFIPAFRNGQPVEAKATLAAYYQPPS